MKTEKRNKDGIQACPQKTISHFKSQISANMTRFGSLQCNHPHHFFWGGRKVLTMGKAWKKRKKRKEKPWWEPESGFRYLSYNHGLEVRQGPLSHSSSLLCLSVTPPPPTPPRRVGTELHLGWWRTVRLGPWHNATPVLARIYQWTWTRT